WLKNKKVLFYT
ncbi:putative inner membrane protein, partial [Chlamydia psittaci 03DC29]